MELYIHIPFCVTKCNYCDFLSFPIGRGDEESPCFDRISRYVDALCAEIEGYAKKYPERAVNTVFIGGGTPSLLAPSFMKRIFQSIGKWTLSPDVEFSIECNPGTVTKEKLNIYKQYGVNRLSFGLQSVNDQELSALGRIHTYDDFVSSYRLAREMGFSNINIDLISAIPGQTASSWTRTLETVLELRPEHISAYSLIIEEGTPFYDLYSESSERTAQDSNVLRLPDEDTERRIYALTDQVLSKAGFHHYEISNYATKGCECRHNLGYWTGEEYLGLGLGASSYVDGTRYRNTDNMSVYTEDIGDMLNEKLHEDIETLSPNNMISEYIILHLRLVKGFSKEEFKERFGHDVCDLYGDVIVKYIGLGLMEEADGFLRLTARGFDVSNIVMAEFLL